MITVLRLGHRPERDKRVTTHCALVARAFGARRLVYTGERDKGFEDSIRRVVESWGGPFDVSYTANWRSFIKRFKGKKIHLTMYGEQLAKAALPKGDLLVIVGAEKVPSEVYQLADMNISVGNQPHSEIAALALVLDRVNGLKPNFTKARLRIEPMQRGKKVIQTARKG